MADELTGMELDAAVHTQVFGAEIRCSHGVACNDILPYSTDIEAAWAVVEWMQQGGFRLELHGTRGWGARFLPWPSDQPIPRHGNWASGETAPESICRAALAAVDAAGGDGP